VVSVTERLSVELSRERVVWPCTEYSPAAGPGVGRGGSPTHMAGSQSILPRHPRHPTSSYTRDAFVCRVTCHSMPKRVAKVRQSVTSKSRKHGPTTSSDQTAPTQIQACDWSMLFAFAFARNTLTHFVIWLVTRLACFTVPCATGGLQTPASPEGGSPHGISPGDGNKVERCSLTLSNPR
jgi:hypothetical protein